MMARGLPRVDAIQTLAAFEAAALGSGAVKSGEARIRELGEIAAGGEIEERRPVGSPLEALARMAEMNERARARGDLWEQRVERAEREAASNG